MTLNQPKKSLCGAGLFSGKGESSAGALQIASAPYGVRWQAQRDTRMVQLNHLCDSVGFLMSNESEAMDVKTPWPHAPLHQLSVTGTYFVTSGTYRKIHHFQQTDRLEVLHRGLLKVSCDFGWQLEAWAIFSNHYHFIAHSPPNEECAASLSRMLASLHEKTAKWINRRDGTPGRKVWHNFRETRLTFQRSYLARLNYVHQNAVKHGLVAVANQYPWCSARWFEREASTAQIKTIYSMKLDQLKVHDEYDAVIDG